MKRLSFFLSICLLFALGSGCAKMPQRADYVRENVAPVVQADENTALIYFFRPSAFGGGAISYFIQEDTVNVGLLKSGSYFAHKTSPGKHTYTAETESSSNVTIDAQAGQTYYVEGGIGMGFWAGVPKLSEVTKPLFDKVKNDLEYIRLATSQETEEYKAKEKEM